MPSFEDVIEALSARRLKGAMPPPPTFLPHGPPEDAPEPLGATPVLDVIGDHIELHYEDAAGAPSRRMVTVRAVHESNGIYYLDGFCHLRRAQRSFRADRVQQIVFSRSTGEIIEDAEKWMKQIRAADPLDAVVRDCRYSLAVLLFMAQCDADFADAERELIVEYLWDISGYNPAIDPKKLKDAIWPKWPDATTFKRAAISLRYKEKPHLKKMLKYMRQIADADGTVTPEEFAAMMEVEQAVGAD